MKSKVVNVFIFLAALLISWDAFSIGYRFIMNLDFTRRTYSLDLRAALVIWLVSVVLLFVFKSWLKWPAIFLSPFILVPAYWFGNGSKHYFKGNAMLWQEEKRESHWLDQPGNLDKTYRVFIAEVGIPEDENYYTEWPHNAAIKLWTKLLGYQEGAYAGVYPDEAEASALFEKEGQPVELISHYEEGYEIFDLPDSVTFSLGGKHYKILLHNEIVSPFLFEDDHTHVKAILLNNELILLQITLTGEHDASMKEASAICLADKASGELFATYWKVDKNKIPTYIEVDEIP